MHRPSDQGICGPFHYRLFGLHVLSDLPLPELAPVDPGQDPDVRIILGAAAEATGTLLEIADIAQFQVEGGREIRVAPLPGIPERNIRLFLLGSAMGMLLHQRGLLPLHANAIEIGGKAIAFMGESGAGKSTLAAWFHDRGYRVVADDVCVIRFDGDGAPWVEPGLPRLRLWKDALEVSGRNPSHLQRSRVGPENLDKYDVPIMPDLIAGPMPVGAVYRLGTADEFAITPLAGVEAAEAVFANTYRGRFITPEMMKPYWRSSLQFMKRIPIFDVRRRWGRGDFDQQCEALLKHAAEAVSAADEAKARG